MSVAADSSVSVRFSQPLRPTVFLLNIRFLFCTCLRCLQSCLPITVLATSAIAMCPNQQACTIHHQWSWASLQQNPLDVFEKEELVDTGNPHPTTSFCLLPPSQPISEAHVCAGTASSFLSIGYLPKADASMCSSLLFRSS